MKHERVLYIAAALLLIAPGLASAQHGATTTLAQVASTQELREVDDDDRIVPGLGVSVDDLDDEDVHDAGGDEIGEVEDVLEDRSGRIVALAVEFDDILDDDEERVEGLERLRLDGDRLVTDLAAAEIRALPVWDD